MNCPMCGSSENKVLWTSRRPKEDRRRVECICGTRWSTSERVDRGTVMTPGNTGQAPPVMAPKTPGNGTPTGEVYSENGSRSDSRDLNPKASESPERERARSKQDTDFARLLKIFCERWQRSNKRPYPASAADKNQLGRFMQQHGNYIEGFAAICDRYLSDRRQFTIDKSGNHRLAWLVTTGLAAYGGTPRETAEQYSARTKREHEARKSAARRPVKDPLVRDLIASLADSKAVANG